MTLSKRTKIIIAAAAIVAGVGALGAAFASGDGDGDIDGTPGQASVQTQ